MKNALNNKEILLPLLLQLSDCLLEQQNFTQFEKVVTNHAKDVMEPEELSRIIEHHDKYKEAIEGTEGLEDANE